MKFLRQFNFELLKCLYPDNNNPTTIYCDRFFTNKTVLLELSKLGHSLIGTIKSDKKNIPKELRKTGKRTDGHCVAVKAPDGHILVSYIDKKKCVLLLSSKENKIKIFKKQVYRNNQLKFIYKPSTIFLYNKNMGGVDVVDSLGKRIDMKRSCRRWPMVVFFAVLGFVFNNYFVLHKAREQQRRKKQEQQREQQMNNNGNNNTNNKPKKLNRIDVLEKLAYQLILPNVKERHKHSNKLSMKMKTGRFLRFMGCSENNTIFKEVLKK